MVMDSPIVTPVPTAMDNPKATSKDTATGNPVATAMDIPMAQAMVTLTNFSEWAIIPMQFTQIILTKFPLNKENILQMQPCPI